MRTMRRVVGLVTITIVSAPRSGVEAQQRILQGREVTVEAGCPASEQLGWLGIASFRCRNCSIGWIGEGESYAFSTEPEIAEVYREGPAHGLLVAGDVLVSVDGRLITTRQGQRALVNVSPGESVLLGVRRDGIDRLVEVNADRACLAPKSASGTATGAMADVDEQYATLRNLLGATAEPGDRVWSTGPGYSRASPPSPDELPPVPPASYVDRAYLGLGFRVTRGTMTVREDGSSSASFEAPLEVLSVDPNGPAARAHLGTGDLILAVDGIDITTPEGASRFVSVRPGDSVRLRVARASGIQDTVVLTTALRTAPSAPQAAAPAGALAVSPSKLQATDPLRFSGSIGPADVDVWGAPASVEVDPDLGVLTIRTDESVIQVRIRGRSYR